MTETRQSRRKKYKRRRLLKSCMACMTAILLTCAIVLFFSFDLDNGIIRGTLHSEAKTVIDHSDMAEQIRNARIENYYYYMDVLREEARIAAAKAEEERLEQERIAAEKAAEEARIAAEKAAEEARLAAELAAEQERLARQQRITDYVSAVAKGEITSDAMKGITFRQNKSAKGKVALSFDDGPFKTYTYDYLDILEEYGVKTTFFCQVQYVERYPEQLQAIVDAGHEIGCHSYAHAQLNKVSSDALRKEIEKCKEILDPFQEITLFRYPYGAYNDRTNGILKEYGLISVMWSVDTEDWAKDDPQAVIDHVKKYTKDGDIILLHEGKKVTLAALPGIITTLRDMGFEIVTVSELLYGNADELSVEEQSAEGSAPQETSGDKPVDEASASTTE